MEFKTRISKIENNDVYLRGEKLSKLVKTGKFTDAIFYSYQKENQMKKKVFYLKKY